MERKKNTGTVKCNGYLISDSHTIEQESEFWLGYGSESRVTVVLCDTFEWALEPGPRAR